MTEVIKLAEADEFWAIRGKAIQSYANLEQSLLGLFAYLSGIEREPAAIILFRISSADARNKIIKKLFKRRFADNFNLFRNSFLDQLRPINLERNEVVHWNTACQMGHDGNKETAKLMLIPPAFVPSPDHPKKDVAGLRAFDAKCTFYSRLLNMFMGIECEAAAGIPEEVKLPWHAIFAQPIVYPPPADHPLFPKPENAQSHVESFLM